MIDSTRTKYHKIHSPWKRDLQTGAFKDDWARPEFGYLADRLWVCDEKVDGTNIRIILQNGQVEIRGRTNQAQIPGPLMNALFSKFSPLATEIPNHFEHGVVLYGEGYGPKIQKVGALYRDDPSFVLFDVRTGSRWHSRGECQRAADILGIDMVPQKAIMTLHDAVELTTKGFESAWGPFQAEGLVLRPLYELKDSHGSRIITKLKTKDFM